ncbi:MAG: hypothetical protein GEV13_31145, partial [Rhodospirillales bacterium]|nr:hypothetical protein [Rhodospirillales bacterium]
MPSVDISARSARAWSAPDVLPVCYQVKAGALCLPFANLRHSHEVDAFRTQKLPDRMTLVCGVVETTHNYVEHP